MDLDIIKNLGDKARVYMDEAEMQEIADSFGPILAYVGQIQKAVESSDYSSDKSNHIISNIFREDIVTNLPGTYTESMVKQMPSSENGFLKVKQIL